MIRPHTLRRFSVLLGAASLTGCGALALDRLAAEHSNRARNEGARASALAQSSRSEFEAARDASIAELDRALALATSPEMMVDVLSLRAQLELVANRPDAARQVIDRMRAIAPYATSTAMLSAGIEATKNPEQALASVREALRFRPAGDELLFTAGMLELEAGALDAAAAHFERLITVSLAQGGDSLGLTSARIGRSVAIAMAIPGTADEPMRLPDELVNLLSATVNEDVQETAIVLDGFCARGPRFEKTLRDVMRAASAARPADSGLGFLRAYVENATGFPKAALQEIERVLALGAGERETDLLWLAVQSHGNLDQQPEAIERARQLLEKMPWHMPALSAFVQAALEQAADSPEHVASKKFIDAARTYYQERRTAALAAAGRDPEQRQARTAEMTRYLAILDAMDQALDHH